MVDNLNDALEVLIQAAMIGQSHGVYTLEEAAMIQSSIKYLQQLSNSNTTDNDINVVE